jgi:RNA polymerase sigma-70 factor (ECF subfamily)
MDEAILLRREKNLSVQKQLSGNAVALDREIFETLYQAYLPKVYNYVCYRVGDEKAAEDLTAEIFERALKNLHRYRSDRGAFSTWLFKITRNLISNHIRSRRRHPEMVSLEAIPSLAGTSLTPEQATIEAENMHKLHLTLQQLPEREQEILALKFGSQLSNQEIAQVMQLNANHIGVVLHRAVRSLRLAFEQG